METAVYGLPVVAKPGPLKPELVHASAVRLTRALTEGRGKAEGLQKAAKGASQALLVE